MQLGARPTISKVPLSLFIILLSVISLSAQPYQRGIGSGYLDVVKDLAKTADGGFILGGQTSGFSAAKEDIMVIKTDANGNLLWSKKYGGPESETLNALEVTPDGGILMAAEKYRMNATNEFMMMIRLNQDGQVLWKQVVHEGQSESEGYGIAPVGNDEYLVAGLIRRMSPGSELFFSMENYSQHGYFVKFKDNGDKVWSTYFDSGNPEHVSSAISEIEAVENNQFLAMGSVAYGANNETELIQNGLGDVRLLTIKMDVDGNVIWAREINTTNNKLLVGSDVLYHSNGNYIIVGALNDGVSENMDVFVINQKPNGEVLWTKSYGGIALENEAAVAEDTDGGIVISGVSRSAGLGLNDAMLFKISENGNLEWAKAYGGYSIESASGVVSADNGFAVGGGVTSFGKNSMDFYLILTDKTGNSGCHEVDMNFSSSNIRVNTTLLSGAKMVLLHEEETPGFVPLNAGNVIERTIAPRNSNICDN